MAEKSDFNALSGRFRGFYPVVIDVETAGFNANTDALLEIAAVTLKMDEDGWLQQDETLHFHVEPFEGANLQPEALAFNGIDPHNPLRGAVSEYDALHAIFKAVRKGLKDRGCNRAIIVAHNANFDHSFLMAAAERAGLKRNPFHPFATFDTAALSGPVLAKRCWRKPASPPACRSTAAKRTPPCTTPNKPPCCFANWLTAGNVSAAGRCPPPISPNKLNKKAAQFALAPPVTR